MICMVILNIFFIRVINYSLRSLISSIKYYIICQVNDNINHYNNIFCGFIVAILFVLNKVYRYGQIIRIKAIQVKTSRSEPL